MKSEIFTRPAVNRVAKADADFEGPDLRGGSLETASFILAERM